MTRDEGFLGWRAVHLDNGLVRAVVVPDVGGRVLQFWLREHAFLFVNRSLAGRLFTPEENWGDGTIASWRNYGGNKTWPAPQGWDGPDQWAGPPDPVLDSGRFQTLVAEPLRAVVQSPPDPRTGLQITRELSLEPRAARARLRRTMRNVSQRPVRWSLWDVTQLDCSATLPRGGPHHGNVASMVGGSAAERADEADFIGAERMSDGVRPGCWMTVPVNPRSRFPNGYRVQYGPQDNRQWRTTQYPGLFGIEYAAELGKVGLDSTAGWVAFSDTRDEWAFVHQFAVDPGATYPDGGATVEVWTHGPGIAAGVDFGQERLRGRFMEMEVLGPLVDLLPGEESSADITWAACRCPGPILEVSEAACTAQRLEVQRQAGGWRVRGTFGVFAPGRIQLRAGSRVVLERSAGPLEPVRLDDVISGPAPFELTLVALEAAGGAPPIAVARVETELTAP